LRAGHTQNRIAKELGLSDKTIRALRDSLLKRTGARTELELGAIAARSGWL
jgi:DNA-binding NarL/FixJ family response regulator